MPGIFNNDSFLNFQKWWWWDPDDYQGSTASVDITLEPLESDIQATWVQPNLIGTITGSTEELEVEAYTGASVDVQLEELESDSYIYLSKLWPSTEPIEMEAHSGSSISASLQTLICEGVSGMGISAFIEPLECEMLCLFGATVEATLEEIDLTAMGNASFVEFAPLLKKLEITLHAGSSIDLSVEPLDFTSKAFVVLQGDIQAETKHLKFTSSSGSAIVASFQPMGISAVGSQPIFGTLNLKSQNFTCSMLATVEVVSTLLATLRRLSIRASGTSTGAEGEASLAATLQKLNAVIEGISGPVADIDASLLAFEAEFLGSEAAYNELDVTLEPLEMHAISFTGTGVPGECEPAETLQFGVTI